MRILIADDNELVRRAITGLLARQKGWQVCGEAVDSSQALQAAQALRPDLVLLDISMPGASGLETARLMRRQIPDAKIFIITHHDASQFLPLALEAGADGCLDKSRISLDLIDAIKDLQSSRRVRQV